MSLGSPVVWTREVGSKPSVLMTTRAMSRSRTESWAGLVDTLLAALSEELFDLVATIGEGGGLRRGGHSRWRDCGDSRLGS